MKYLSLNRPKGHFGIFLCLGLSTAAVAGVNEQCYRLHNRLSGIPPTESELSACTALIKAGNAQQAALTILEKPSFYSDTLRYAFNPWTNEDGKRLVDFNDFVATLIGMTRDDSDFRTILSEDVIYTCEDAQGLPGYASDSNEHYAACGEKADIKSALRRRLQSELNPDLAGQESVPAGVYTTRAFAEAFYDAGTNRLATRVSLKNFLCEDIEAFNDTTIADFRIRQDVDRAPGGTPKTFVNECKGCHAGMDPLTGAFAHLDWDAENGRLTYDNATVVQKFFNNALIFSQGYRTVGDDWVNLWTKGQNARVGWGVAEGIQIRGNGPKALGQMYANTEQFSSCMASFAYRTICIKDSNVKDSVAKELGKFFKDNGYKMKPLFAKVATSCLGD